MAAVLQVQPLADRVIAKPAYRNRNLANFSGWYRDNEPALGQYFLALPADQTDFEDFREFVLCQFDVECELQASAQRSVYGDVLEQRAYAHGDFGSDR